MIFTANTFIRLCLGKIFSTSWVRGKIITLYTAYTTINILHVRQMT